MFSRPIALPVLLLAAIAFAMAVGGPIAQLPDYHAFADQRPVGPVSNAADVLSNLGFLAVGIYGMLGVQRARTVRALDGVRFSYGLFFTALILTAAGSSWYHLSPDDMRLMSDRLPIAIACSALLAAAARRHLQAPRCINGLLLAFAVGSVAWWGLSGDLRPYLWLQFAPLAGIPVLLWKVKAGREEKLAYGSAIACYVAAKACELADHAVFAVLALSGHTLKHLFAAAGAFCIARYFVTLSAATKGEGTAPMGQSPVLMG